MLKALCVILLSLAASTAEAETVAQILTQEEYNIGRAYLTHDPALIDQIFADDFSSYSGTSQPDTKANWLKSVANPRLTTTTFKYSPFDIRVVGAMAIVQGENEDDLHIDGQDASGLYSWMDVFELRQGRWLLIANETTPVKDKSDRRAGNWVTISAPQK